MSTFTVRPSNSEKEAFRVKLTSVSLLSLKVKPGDLVLLNSLNDEGFTSRPAIAWDNSGSAMKDSVVLTSKTLQDLYGFKLGDKIGIARCKETLVNASTVVVKPLFTISNAEQSLWQGFLSAMVPPKHDILAPGQHLTISIGNKKGEFEVSDVGGLLGRVTDNTQFVFGGQTPSTVEDQPAIFELNFNGLGGLAREIEQVKDQVDFIIDPGLHKAWSKYRPEHGLLLYGSQGTGKTELIEVLAANPWGSVVRWTPGTKLPAASYPRLIITDLAEITSGAKIAELLTLFREIKGTHTLIVGECRHPNDIPERLRTSNAFGKELELPIPDADQRFEIVQAFCKGDDYPTNTQLREIADRTHGFVGADLYNLIRTIWMTASKRQRTRTAQVPNGSTPMVNSEHGTEHDNNGITPTPNQTSDLTIIQSDIDLSLPQIRPSALQQVFLEKPNVHWSDIGGQHALKHKLTSAVNRTLSPTLRTRMSQLGLTVTKGVLLYGPPGCSKTLLAKALATEAELNFLAVKGAELISMYVGESERATREVFRKARAAAPSILFFDEIDAIASRGDTGGAGGGNLNVLTTLLNEMDGFEELRNVIVIAATNKPQSIDPALLRPGRFDNVVYVGLPDLDTRREILESRFRGISIEEGARSRIAEFAERTEGYSGAEVVAICKAAGEYAFEAEVDFVRASDVDRAIWSAPKGVTKEVIAEYERWNAARGSVG